MSGQVRWIGRIGHVEPMVSAPANRHDLPLLEPTLEGLSRFDLPEHPTAHLDAGYDSTTTRALLNHRGIGYISRPEGMATRPLAPFINMVSPRENQANRSPAGAWRAP
jgi:hypothetical protein